MAKSTGEENLARISPNLSATSVMSTVLHFCLKRLYKSIGYVLPHS
jgi:hypothetical protein